MKKKEIHWTENLPDGSFETLMALQKKYRKLGWERFYVDMELIGDYAEDGSKLVFCAARWETDAEFNLRVEANNVKKAKKEARRLKQLPLFGGPHAT